jgi:hypothetical protein
MTYVVMFPSWSRTPDEAAGKLYTGKTYSISENEIDGVPRNDEEKGSFVVL